MKREKRRNDKTEGKERLRNTEKIPKVQKIEKDGLVKKVEESQRVRIFVKVDGGRTSTMEMEMSDKVDDIVKKIPISDQDVYVTSGGRILRGSDKLESCEVRDGSTVQVEENTRTRRVKEEKEQVAQLDDGMYAMACEQLR